MRILLDTHIWLWWLSEPHRLSPFLHQTIADTEHQIFVSVVSVWEIAIKWKLGKIDLPEAPALFVPSRLARDGFEVLPILTSHALQVAILPTHHNDPFDRLLIAQAQTENLHFATVDPKIALYDLQVLS